MSAVVSAGTIGSQAPFLKSVAAILCVSLLACERVPATSPETEEVVGEGEVGITAGDKWFQVGAKLDGERLYQFRMSKTDLWDLNPRWDDCVFGSGHYAGGDRVGYHTAYFFYAHQDPDKHDYLDAIRFVVQIYGASPRLNDKHMPELPVQGLPPYPYERGATVAVDKSIPGGVVELWHNRTTQYDQMLAEFIVPAVSEQNPKVRWYYQLGGLFVAVHDDHGPVSRLIVTSMHPHYAYRITGVETGGIKGYPSYKDPWKMCGGKTGTDGPG